MTPVAKGRSFVLATAPSNFLSIKSLMTQPALRMITTPKVKISQFFSDGMPRAANHSAHQVGHSNNSMPMGLCKRMSLAYSANLDRMEYFSFRYTGASTRKIRMVFVPPNTPICGPRVNITRSPTERNPARCNFCNALISMRVSSM